MEYKLITTTVKEIDIDVSYMAAKTDINYVIQWLAEQRDKGATHLDFTASKDYDGDIETISIDAIIQRYETDEELNARKARESEARETSKKWAEKVERQQYEALKKKYENK